MTEAKTAAISLGANLGDWLDAFSYALFRFHETPGLRLRAVSNIYRTPPWGRTDQPDFRNMAALVDCALSPRALLNLCLAIETERGRVRGERWGPRTLDLDVIAFGDSAINEPELVLPHPRAAERAFVLIPLSEIAPNLKLGGKTVRELAAACDASAMVLEPEASAAIKAASRANP